MTNEAKVGLVVLVSLAVFVATFLTVANVQLTGETIRYRTYFSYIGGLNEGGMVRYGGRKAGTIRSLEPWQQDMTKTEIVFELRAEIPVNEESAATIASLNALGQNYLEIEPGSIDAPRIPPDGTVRAREALTFSDLTIKVAEVADSAATVLQRVDGKIGMVADDLHAVLLNLQELTGERNRRNVTAMLENTNEFLETQSPKIDRVTSQISDTLVRVDSLADDFSKLARDADETVLNLNRTVEDTREPLRDGLDGLSDTLGKTQQVLQDVRAMLLVNEGNVTAMVENFRVASEDIAALSSELRQRPWSLLRVRPRPDRQVPAITPAAQPPP